MMINDDVMMDKKPTVGRKLEAWGGSSKLFRVPGVVGWGHSFARRLDVLKKIVFWNTLQNEVFCLICNLSFLTLVLRRRSRQN
jgi:hypothetical protein